jgi:O-methyltransferase domain
LGAGEALAAACESHRYFSINFAAKPGLKPSLEVEPGTGPGIGPCLRAGRKINWRARLGERLAFHAGDFLSAPLPSADVLVVGRVLHNWDLATKKMLLAKAYEALPGGGALIVYERLIDDDRRANAAGLLASLHMLLVTAGGFDFTAADCIGWMRDAGFQRIYVEPLALGLSMVVATK